MLTSNTHCLVIHTDRSREIIPVAELVYHLAVNVLAIGTYGDCWSAMTDKMANVYDIPSVNLEAIEAEKLSRSQYA